MSETKIQLGPPLARWEQAKTCQLIAETQARHGEVVAVRITEGDRWWELDDIVRQACGLKPGDPLSENVLFVRAYRSWVWIARSNLDAVVTGLTTAGALDRLRARELPVAVECTHTWCSRRRALQKSPPKG